MGCHTWFYRPISKEEREEVRTTKAVHQVEEYWGKEALDGNESIYNDLMKSIQEDNAGWIEHGYGFEHTVVKQGDLFYTDDTEFHDVFRVKNYPKRRLFNLRGVRRFLRKRGYGELTNEQVELLKKFWVTYPKGFIAFG
ncbi:hypothetical protein D3C80_1509840 [compost metagenome]